MRKVKADPSTLKLLNEGAANAAGKADTDKRFAQLSDQLRMLQFALGNIFKTLATYPRLQQEVDGQEYRGLGLIRALSKKLGPDFEQLVEDEARGARDESFWELSNSDDKQKNLTPVDTVGEDCYVIITTDCPDHPDQGVFRSKMDVGGQEFADFKGSFVGKKVGDTVEMTAQGVKHVATVLGVRKKPDVNANTNVTAEQTSDAQS